MTAEVRRYLGEHPEVGRLVPALLDRGDPDGRGFALRLALMARTPELLAALRDFALGQRGPDEMRMEAAGAATEAGLFPAGPVRMWLRGEWTDILMMGFEIHHETQGSHPPEVQDILMRASKALQEGELARAEELYLLALAREPEARDAQLNLAETLRLQGREAEADERVRRLHERDPDYLFARTYLAGAYTRRGEYDRAREILKPLLSRRRMHISELNALCGSEFLLAMAQGERESARGWVDMLARGDPDNPNLPILRARLEAPSTWRRPR
jgi:tetratricopeptide (TPR) repeat protein